MPDQTVTARMKRQRDLRGTEGWHEVKVWVPTEQDAADVRRLAAERRAKAEALDGLSKEISTVTPELEARTAKAIAKYGSAAYNTPSGAALQLLTQLAEEDDLTGFSRAFVILARAKPTNAAFIAAAVPAKITNCLVRHRGIDPAALVKWTDGHPGWENELKDAVRDPTRFEAVVASIAETIKSKRKSH